MRKIAVLLLAFTGGCGAQWFDPFYDRPNPWRTASDQADYEEMTERNWQLEMRTTWQPPQNHAPNMTLPELEAWRDSVLVNVDTALLQKMRDQSVQKVAGLESRAHSMAPIDENSKIQIYELLFQARNEKIRLRMIDERLASR